MLIEKFVRRLVARRELRRRRELGMRKTVGSSKRLPLYNGASHHGTKERSQLLRRASVEPRAKPKDTLQVTWIGEDTPYAKGDGNGEDVLV